MKPTYLSVKEAAERAGVHRATIYRWIGEGMSTEKIAGHTVIRASVLDREAKQHKGSQ